MKAAMIVFFLLGTLTVSGMDAREVIGRMQKVYATEKLAYKCTYSLFRGHTSDVAHQSYEGYVYRQGELLYQQTDQTELIYGKDFFLRINHEEQAMELNAAQQAPPATMNTDQALKECSEVLLEDKGAYYEIKLVIKNTSSLPFSQILMRIGKKNYHLEQLDMYYTTVQDFSTDGKQDLQLSHLRIAFGALDTAPESRPALFTTASYLKQDGDALVPVGACTGYELIDNRLKRTR